MAHIEDESGNKVTDGLESPFVSDKAFKVAMQRARELEKTLYLFDGDDRYTVPPNGEIEVDHAEQ